MPIHRSKHFWQNLIGAADATPLNFTRLRGASGLQHSVVAAGVDRPRRRLVVVCKEVDPRAATLVQADLQAVSTEHKVIAARPILVSLGAAVQKAIVDHGSLDAVGDLFADMRKRVTKVVPADLRKKWHESEYARSILVLVRHILQKDKRAGSAAARNLRAEVKRDPSSADRMFGICPIPLYDFTDIEIAALAELGNPDAAADILRSKGILQYFFPAPDQIALGLVDRSAKVREEQLVQQVQLAPEVGHPFGPSELTSVAESIVSVIEQLQSKKLIVEGEFGLELSSAGHSVRQTVKFRPRESLISKLLNKISISLSLRDLFPV